MGLRVEIERQVELAGSIDSADKRIPTHSPLARIPQSERSGTADGTAAHMATHMARSRLPYHPALAKARPSPVHIQSSTTTTLKELHVDGSTALAQVHTH